MFSQLQFVRLRTAEKALRDGRLDEALRLATASDLKGHRRAVAVCEALAKQYIERARGHYRADRFAEGLADLDKAEVAGATGDEVRELRRNVQIVAHEVRRQDSSRRRRIDAAKKRIEQGSLVAGQRLLADAGPCDPVVADLQRDIAHRSDDVDRLIKQAQQFLGDGQIAAAVSRLEAATVLDHHDERLAALRSELCRCAFRRVRESIVAGRLARASDELTGLGTLGSDAPERRELADALVAAREASAALVAARYADARRQVMSLQRIIPQATWTGRVMDQLKQIDGLATELTTGPLGERMVCGADAGPLRDDKGRPGTADRADISGPRGTGLDETVMLPTQAAGGLPGRLLLLVEGGGSYLLLRDLCTMPLLGYICVEKKP